MFPPYKPFIPQTIGEVMDYLGMMMLSSPTFIDKTGYFPHNNIHTTFRELNEGLGLIRLKLGEERYLKLMDMSDRMRAHFEADPEDKTDDTIKGREIIHEMETLLKQSVRQRGATPDDGLGR
jgi:hypothetical protein